MRKMLIHDRLELPPDHLVSLEEELIAVVCRYFEIDRDTTRFDLQQYERKAALVANFPLLRSKT
jgi:cell division topological specificity factor